MSIGIITCNKDLTILQMILWWVNVKDYLRNIHSLGVNHGRAQVFFLIYFAASKLSFLMSLWYWYIVKQYERLLFIIILEIVPSDWSNGAYGSQSWCILFVIFKTNEITIWDLGIPGLQRPCLTYLRSFYVIMQ